MSTTLAFDILARDHGASSTFNAVGNSADRNSARVRKIGAALKYAALGVAAGASLAAVAGYKLAKGAAEDEAATKKLALQMRNSADASKGQIAATEQWITAQGKAYGVTDDQLRPALGKLVAVTHDVTKARKLATLSENVAAGTGKSLESVTSAVAKAQIGSLGGLSKLGVATKNAAGDTLSLKTVTQQMADTYRGQAAKAADTTAGRFQRLQVMLSETGEAIGYKLLPPATEFAGWVLDTGVPAMQDLVHWFQENTDEIVTTGTAVGKDLLPKLVELAKIAGDVVGWFNDLPGDVKSVGVEVGIAALVVPMLGDAFTTMSGKVVAGTTRAVGAVRALGTETAITAMKSQRLQTNLVNLAGMAGMVAIEEGSRRGSKAVTLLGGALEGAFVGGTIGSAIPGIGTAIGGVAGAAIGANVAMIKTAHSTGAYDDVVGPARSHVADFAHTLDQVTGAATRAARAQVLQAAQESGMLSLTQRLGVNTRDLIGATLGNEGATRRLSKAYRQHSNELTGVEQIDLSSWLRHNTQAFEETGAAIRQNRHDLQTWRQALKGLPPKVQTAVKAIGTDITRKQIRDIEKKYGDLSKKQVRTIIQAVGTEMTVKKIHGVWTALENGHKIKADLNPFLQTLGSQTDHAKDNASHAAVGILKALEKGPHDAKADLNPFAASFRSSVPPIVSQAHSGGVQVGGSLKSGVIFGFQGTASALASAAASAVRQAIAAAKAAGRSHSPSKLMAKEGKNLGDGLTLGLRDSTGRGQMSAAAAHLMADLVKGIRAGQVPLDKVMNAVENRVASTGDRLKSLLGASRDFAAGFQSFGTSVFAADYGETGPTIDSMLTYAASQRDTAKQGDLDVQRLLKMGLSKSLIKQFQSQGASGLASLHAAAQGNTAQIRLLNSLDKQTHASWAHAGTSAAGVIYGADIRGARRDDRVANTLEAILHALTHGDKGEIHIHLEGHTLVETIRKHQRNKGQKPTV